MPDGWALHYLPITGSTNEDAKRAAIEGCPDRTIIAADEQRAGRGRLNRRWIAPPGTSLLFSVVLHRSLQPVCLTALCSVSVAEAIYETTGLAARIKWPNDVMLRDRKVCGLLTEVIPRGGRQVTIVGIGLNVNLDPAAVGLPPTATSLSNELGRTIPRRDLLLEILRRIDGYLALDDLILAPTIFARWEDLLWRRQQEVQVDGEGATVRGVVEGLAPSGALRVRRLDCTRVEISVGELVS